MKILIVYVLLIIVVLLLVFHKETFYTVAPWDVDDCRLQCFESSQPQVPWNKGRIDGAWNDPAAQPNATFDVVGCLQRCGG